MADAVGFERDSLPVGRHGRYDPSLRAIRRSSSPLPAPGWASDMIVLIDNYDSFTYNLVQRLGEIDPGIDLQVVRNDQITVEEIEEKNPSHIIISPGPCTPREAGISNETVARFAPRVPLLGVCLGHQCIGHTLGAKVVRADRIMHGKT